jgi:hypothetical protein
MKITFYTESTSDGKTWWIAKRGVLVAQGETQVEARSFLQKAEKILKELNKDSI